MTTITRQQLQARLAESTLVLVEALPPLYFDSGHLPGVRI